MKQFFTFLAGVLLTATTYAQIGINTETPDASAALDITSSTAGILIPRMTQSQRDAVLSPATGLMIYQTDQTAGFYFWDGAAWTKIDGVDGQDGADGVDGVDGQDGASYTQPTYLNNTFYAELGGYVIELNSDGTHGIVVAMQDQGTSNWYEADDFLSNASNHDIYGAKFKDWRLPTKRELDLVYGVYNSGNGANLNHYHYWSSTESGADTAWFHHFINDDQNDSYKLDQNKLRAVRVF